MSFWLPREVLNCLGWTLLHFLWQGLVMAGLFAGALALLRRQSANARYLAGCFALLLMAIAPLATFNYLLKPEPAESRGFKISTAPIVNDNSADVVSGPVTAPPVAVTLPKPTKHVPDIFERVETMMPGFVAAWSLGVLLLSCRLLAGWLQIQRLKRSATAALVGPWQSKLKELAARIGVSRPLRLLQSAWVEVPTVIGWLRPVILLPASCLTGLTPGQLESILVHELAHIRRHDYLINLLQNILETLLFYHPAVWWVSRRIRQEREHCCDDLAVKICGDALAYARALATLEELRPAPAQLQLGASGAPLLERIRRLLDPARPAARRPGWALAVVITMMVTLLLTLGLRSNRATAANSTAPATGTSSVPTASPTALAPIVVGGNKPVSEVSPALSGLNQAPAAVTNHEERPAPQAQTPPQSRPSPATTQTNEPPSKPHVQFVIKWAEMEVSDKTTNALTGLLADRGSVVNLPATFTFSEFLTMQPTNFGEPEYRIILHTNSFTGPLAAVLSDHQYRMDIQALEQRDGVDILTPPKSTSEIDRHLRVQTVDAMSIVIGGSQPGNTNGPRVLTNQLTGPVVDIVPHFATDGRTLELNITGTINEFVGYEDPTTVTNRAGKPMPKNWGIPHFRMRQFSATVAVGDGRSVVLGAAAVPITNTKRTNHKVPLLGDLPYLGHLFRSSFVTTNTVQKSLMLFITPRLVNPDGTPWAQSQQALLNNLVEQGKVLYESGKLDEAEAKLNRVLREDSGNFVAIQYLKLVQEKQKTQQARLDPSRTNLVYTSKGRQNIISKLDRIRVPSVAYTNLPLGEVIKSLTVIAKNGDPEEVGINFFLSREAVSRAGIPGAIDPVTKFFANLLPADTGEISSVTININPKLENVRLADVLEAITKTASVPIKYSILDYAVVFSLRPDEPVPLEIRTFHVDPNTFREGLESSVSARTSGSGVFSKKSNSADSVQVSIRDFFGAIGVDFNTNNPTNINKAFVWSDNKGVLTVRSTAQDLNMIAAVLEALNAAPAQTNMKQDRDLNATFGRTLDPREPQINFKVKFFEVSQNDDRALGFNWTLGNFKLSGSNPPTVVPLATNGVFRTPLNAPAIASLSGILTPSQFKVAMQALESRDGVKAFTARDVTTENGRHVAVQAVDPDTNAAQNLVETRIGSREFGPLLDIIPYVSADELSVHMKTIATVTELTGLDPKPLKTDMEGNPITGSGELLPHFHYRQSVGEVTILDGNTYVFNVMTSYPTSKTNSSGKKLPVDTTAPKKNLMIFVTPTLINHDGTRFHVESEAPLAKAKEPIPGK